MNRRSFLSGVGALAGVGCLGSRAHANLRVFGPLSQEGSHGRNIVLLQLSGGNDGVSMVVPHADDLYHKARSATRIEAGKVLRLDDYRGLHPALRGLHRFYESGDLAIVEGCGYPDPVRSHFKALEIWHTGHTTGRKSGPGWVGRMAESCWSEDPTVELVVHVGTSAPYSLFSNVRPPVSFTTPAGYRWVGNKDQDSKAYRRIGQQKDESISLDRLRGVLRNAQDSSDRIRRAAVRYTPRVKYPTAVTSQALQTVAAMIDSDLGARVYSVELGGFDTHDAQRGRHDTLMRRLNDGLSAFYEDISHSSGFNDTIVVVYSEFGRRLQENGSKGTDHGVAGPMLVLGSRVKGGLYGKHPSLSELDKGDLIHTTDFRSVYGTLMDDWFELDHAEVLGARYPKLDLLSV